MTVALRRWVGGRRIAHRRRRNGFQREGLLRGYIAYPDEQRGDVYVYALLKES